LCGYFIWSTIRFMVSAIYRRFIPDALHTGVEAKTESDVN
jgi:hypothetical protein